MDGEAFRTRHLDEDAVMVDGGRLDRLGDRVVQVVQRLGADAEGGELAQPLLCAERRRQELNERLAGTLVPAPYPASVEARDRVEGEVGEKPPDRPAVEPGPPDGRGACAGGVGPLSHT